MTQDMLERANRNKEEAGAENVLFVKSPITKIDLTNECADCIISNCVVNLVPEHEKQLVFNETFRLLKPGGRLAISDILLKKELPDELKKSMALYVGCISGASRVNEYEEYLRNAGFRGRPMPKHVANHAEKWPLIVLPSNRYPDCGQRT